MVWGWDLWAYYDGPFPFFDWKPKLQLDLPTKELVSRKKIWQSGTMAMPQGRRHFIAIL